MDTQALLSLSDDLHQVKGNISQIQATLNNVLSKAPTSTKFDELKLQFDDQNNSDNKVLYDRVSSLVKSSQLKVAVKLKSLFDTNKVPLLSSLSKLNFKTLTDDDEHLVNFLNYSGTNSKFSYSGEYPPPLPVIQNKALLLRTFTDKSFRQPSDFLDSVAQGTCFNNLAHNEKLSIKGYAFLQVALLELLDDRFPGLYPEELEVLQQKILSPEILAKLAFGYGMVDAFKYNLSKTLSYDEKLEVFSKLFSSYVSAIRTTYSFEYAKLFVSAVFQPIITSIKENYPLNGLAKLQVEFLIKQLEGVSLVYESIQDEPHVVHLKINGEILTTGTSSSSQEEASERAAQQLVENVTLLQKVMHLTEEKYDAENSTAERLNDKEHGNGTTNEGSQQANNVDQSSSNEASKSPTNTPKSDSIYPSSNSARATTSSPSNTQVFPQAPPTKNSAPQPQPFPTSRIPQLPSNPNARAGDYPLPYTNIAKPVSSLPKVPVSGGQTPQLYGPISYNVVPGMPGGPTQVPPTPVVDASGVPIIGQSYKVGMESNAKNTLYALLGQHHLVPVYKTSKAGLDYHATVTVNDTIIGVGYDSNKRFASQKAAMSALGNDSALKTLGIVLEKSKPADNSQSG